MDLQLRDEYLLSKHPDFYKYLFDNFDKKYVNQLNLRFPTRQSIEHINFTIMNPEKLAKKLRVEAIGMANGFTCTYPKIYRLDSGWISITETNSESFWFYLQTGDFETLVKLYKIHLMPKQGEEEFILQRLLSLVTFNQLEPLISMIKVLVNCDDELKVEQKPKIVLYISTGRDVAQQVLNKIYQEFEHDRGAGWVPKYNHEITDFIFFAQGDRDIKNDCDCHQYFDWDNNGIYYKSDVTGKEQDFSLHNMGQHS